MDGFLKPLHITVRWLGAFAKFQDLLMFATLDQPFELEGQQVLFRPFSAAQTFLPIGSVLHTDQNIRPGPDHGV